MAEVIRSTHIAGSPEEAWAVLCDFGSISAWAPNVDHSCLLTDQVDGIGAARRVQVGRNALVETIQVWDPPSTLGYRLEGLPPVIESVTNTWTIDAEGRGARATLTTEIDAGPRPPQRLVARVVGRVLGRASDQMLGGLAGAVSPYRGLVERRAASEGGT